MDGVEPLASPDDCLLAEQIAKADPKVREQLKLRGVTDMDLVACDPWSGKQSVTATKCSNIACCHAVQAAIGISHSKQSHPNISCCDTHQLSMSTSNGNCM